MKERVFGCVVLAIAGILAWAPVGLAGEMKAEGAVSAVTVYREQALVTRRVSADLPAGVSELVVANLPERVVAESLFATAGEGAAVRAVRFRTRAVSDEPREEVRRILDEIKRVQREIEKNKMLQDTTTRAAAYLGRLQGFVAPTAEVELSKGVLNAKTLKEMTEFLLAEQAARAETGFELRLAAQDLQRELELLGRKRAELTAGSSKTVREAVLFLDAEAAGRAEISLTYLVTNAGWEPAYNLRAENGQSTVALEYNAGIYQMSGEDWEGVEMTLSTASPALVADAPELAPFWVALAAAAPPGALRPQQAIQEYAKAQGRLALQAREQIASRARSDNEANLWQMNVISNTLQLMETNQKVLGARVERERPAEAVSVTYRLPGKTSLASRSDRQLVRIADLALKGDFYYVATPVLSGYVYREAEVSNDSELAMLEGPATVYLDGGFVGRSSLPLVAHGQKFTIGFGFDPQLRAGRELAERTEESMGANRGINLEYVLSLENYKDAPVRVRLYDRLPYPTRGADIRVTLGDSDAEPSDDELYLENERPKGILRWDVEVPARASGTTAHKITYAYKMEFDRKQSVTTPVSEGKNGAGAAGAFRAEFDELTRGRRKAH